MEAASGNSKKKIKWWQWILIVSLVGFIINVLTEKRDSGSGAAVSGKKWAEMTQDEKKVKLLSQYQSNVTVDVRKEVKSKVNFPETVDFDYESFGKPFVFVKDLEKRLILTKGNFSAKNAFGVESGFYAEAIVSFTDSTYTIEDVKIYETK